MFGAECQGGYGNSLYFLPHFRILNLFKNITSVKKEKKKMPSRPQQHSDGPSADPGHQAKVPRHPGYPALPGGGRLKAARKAAGTLVSDLQPPDL